VGVSTSVAHEAKRLIPQVKAEFEQEAMNQLSNLAAEVIHRHPDWATFRVGVRESHAKAHLIEMYGTNLPLIMEEIARYKD
jgi:hypothetical protein